MNSQHHSIQSDSTIGPPRQAVAAHDISQFISFTIGAESYGVDIMAVREIKGWSEITRLPEQPDYVRGVLNLRGAIVPIVDLRCRFGQGYTEPSAFHVVIIVQIADQLVGLLADRVSDIVSVDPTTVRPVPNIGHDERLGFLTGIATIENSMIGIIELSRLLSDSVDHRNTANA